MNGCLSEPVIKITVNVQSNRGKVKNKYEIIITSVHVLIKKGGKNHYDSYPL